MWEGEGDEGRGMVGDTVWALRHDSHTPNYTLCFLCPHQTLRFFYTLTPPPTPCFLYPSLNLNEPRCATLMWATRSPSSLHTSWHMGQQTPRPGKMRSAKHKHHPRRHGMVGGGGDEAPTGEAAQAAQTTTYASIWSARQHVRGP